jgi:hypothetical protein
MPLQKSVKDIPLVGGIGEGIDSKVLPEGRMAILRNCFYEKPGSLRKRKGAKALAQRVLGGASNISEGRGVVAHKDELLALDGEKGYTWSPLAGKSWADKGKVNQHEISTDTRISSLLSTVNSPSWDAASAGGVTVYVYAGEETGGTNTIAPVIATVVDSETGAELISSEQLYSEGVQPHVLAVEGEIFGVTWRDSTADEIYYSRLTLQGTGDIAWGTPVKIADCDGAYAAKGLALSTALGEPGLFAVSWYDSVLGRLNYSVRSVVTGASRGATFVAVADVLYTWVVVNPLVVGLEDVYVYWCTYNAGTGVAELYYRVYTNTVTLTLGTTLIETYGGGEPGEFPITLSAVRDFTTETTMVTYWGMTSIDQPGTDPIGVSQTRTCNCPRTGSPTAPVAHTGGATLYSDAFNYKGQHYYFAFQVPEEEPCTAFLIDGDGNAVARFFVKEAAPEIGTDEFYPMVRKVSDLGDGKWFVPCWRTVATAVEYVSGQLGQTCDLVGVTVDLNRSGGVNAFVANGGLLLGGGLLHGFDNARFHESGFNYGPGEILAVSAVAGGSIANGDYNVKAVYFWRDEDGNEHYSALSIDDTSLPVTLGGTAIECRWKSYRLTDKANVRVLVYRTLLGALGGPYYFAGSVDNDPDAESVTATLTQSDATIATAPTLYTTGGVLENTPAPPPLYCWEDGQTAYIVPADDRRSLWASKPISSRLGVEWSGQLVTRMPTGGELVAGGSIDGNVILFEEKAIRVLLGSRPTATGSGGYLDTRPVSSEVGCVDRRSVAQFRGGIVFKSHRGISMLDRSLQVQYIGGPVEDHNEHTILATTVITRPGIGHVRFLLDTAEVLCWDYVSNLWSIYDEPIAAGCTSWQTHYASIRVGGEVLHKLDRENWRDKGQGYPMRLRTPWIHVAGFQGWQRTKRVTILGDLRSVHTLTVRLFNDYDDTAAVQEVVFDSDDLQTAIGASLQARIRPQFQKAQAIAVEIEAEGKGETLWATSLSLELGVKKGMVKLKKPASG